MEQTRVPDRIVVGAAILDGDRLLAAQRSEPPALAGGWELPGGKVEAGETDESALIRECLEELGVEVELRDKVGGDWFMNGGLVLRVWTAVIAAGVPAPLEDHRAIRWLEPDEWYDVAWLAADLPVIAALRDHLDLPPSPRPHSVRPR